MQIAPPFGFTEVVPYLKNQKARFLPPAEVPAFARGSNAIPVSYTEFQPACRDYPIVFTSGDGKSGFAPVAVMGLATGENLFVSDGRWAAGRYIPAYVRRYPFCMARVNVNNVERQDRLICIEKAHLADDGEALFDEKGAPSEKWKELERLLSEYETDLERSREMCAILADYALFEPFTVQATPKAQGAKPLQITGLYRVAEKKLADLNAAQLKNLLNKGILPRVYLHLFSLENFGRLLDRKAAAGSL
jgi:hypothetical protein